VTTEINLSEGISRPIPFKEAYQSIGFSTCAACWTVRSVAPPGRSHHDSPLLQPGGRAMRVIASILSVALPIM
jgi:hypothetical protein